MQIRRINQPANQCPGFFGIPAPVAAPGLIRPHGAANDPNGEQQKANRNRAVAKAVQ